VDYLAFSAAERQMQRRRLALRALTVEEALGIVPSFGSVAQALVEGFAEALSLTLVPGELSPQERALSAEIRDRVYAAPGWTARL
jgi:lipoate-protein ligase A